MTKEKSVVKSEDGERIILSNKLAMGAGENTSNFQMLPSITVHNNRTDKEHELGVLIKSTRTQSGYENEEFPKPFKGVITKVRMYLRTKYKFVQEGAAEMISDEFENYSDLITLKIKRNGKYEVLKDDNYKNIQEEFSQTNKYGKIEKELDLIYSLYVITDLDKPEVVRIICRGTSRSGLFDYMKQFSHREGDHMSSHWTEFSTEEITVNFRGEPLQNPVWAISFSKQDMITMDEMRKAVDVQVAIEKEFANFKRKPKEVEEAPFKSLEQPEQKEELPTINIEEEQPDFPQIKEKEEDEIKMEDIPI